MAKPVRCAIYTRKSSEEGLEQAFNSLHAQREACEAYITSQRHEGWRAIETAYDDGGCSGGTMERPGLQQLLADIAHHLVDVIVVYKVDRLTRSLVDFAKIVELLDSQGISFVSVTQQFNTTTSMGRLTLNVLLSFAQFEREVTGERIRDKIAASKKKGMWMGGNVPLGYNAVERKLLVNGEEAETVRVLFRLYVEHGCVRKVAEEADRRSLSTKRRTTARGNLIGGVKFSRGHIYRILQNPIYIGEIHHKGNAYEGVHDAIVDHDLWGRVQERLTSNRRARRNGGGAKEPSLLTGLLLDGDGNRFTPSHAVKSGRRYRYYVGQMPMADGANSGGRRMRISAHEIERPVLDALADLLANPDKLIDAADLAGCSSRDIDTAIKLAQAMRKELTVAAPARRREIVTATLSRVTLGDDSVEIRIDRAGLCGMLGTTRANESDPVHTIRIPVTLRRRGVELRLVIDSSAYGRSPRQDPSLIKAIVRAHDWNARLLRGDAEGTTSIAREEGVANSYVTRVVRLAFLAPDITQAILDGRQPAHLSAERLVNDRTIPLAWSDQRAALGFAEG